MKIPRLSYSSDKNEFLIDLIFSVSHGGSVSEATGYSAYREFLIIRRNLEGSGAH
jgi:hypothetical protein